MFRFAFVSGKKRPRSGSFPREKKKRVKVTRGPKSPADPGAVKKAKSMDTEKPLESPGKLVEMERMLSVTSLRVSHIPLSLSPAPERGLVFPPLPQEPQDDFLALLCGTNCHHTLELLQQTLLLSSL